MKRTARKGGAKRDGRGVKGVRNMKSMRRDTLVIPMIGRNGVETKKGEDMTLIENEEHGLHHAIYSVNLTWDEPIHY